VQLRGACAAVVLILTAQSVWIVFCGWSSNEQPQMQAGFCAVTILGLEAAAELLDLFGRQTLAARCRKRLPRFAGGLFRTPEISKLPR
jgi:hypothetical protein